MEAIKYFLNGLPGKYKSRGNSNGAVSLFKAKGVNNSRDAYYVAITNLDYMKNVIIPFFDSLTK